ncbi:MAG TPA: hypothetical protein VG733_05635 [Chthoniobacteraceae bacterium]|nr:hypothetical protein [Chthoniobacteraceae bacterium]
MPGRKRKFKKGVITGLCWLGLFLFLAYAYWVVMNNFGIRDFWDPAYVSKAELLQARLKENPGHRLWLILGSSRVDEGLRPGLLVDEMHKEGAPLVFNFGIGGSDLFRQLVVLRRLRAEGVKPAKVVLEIGGALMDRQTEMFADSPALLVRARRDEIDELVALGGDHQRIRGDWLKSRLDPFYESGMQIPNQALEFRLLPFPFMTRFESHPYDAWGWYVGPADPPPLAEYQRRLDLARKEYESDFTDQFAISPQFDQEMHKTLDYCKAQGFDFALLRMPEDRNFQAFYPAHLNELADAYLANITKEYHIRMIDARSWFLDPNNFVDGHHLTGNGARDFTLRFYRELSSP